MPTTPRTYQLPYPDTTAPDGGLVTLPALSPSQRAAAELERPWSVEEAVRAVQYARGSCGTHAAGLLDAALVRLAMALHTADARAPFERGTEDADLCPVAVTL